MDIPHLDSSLWSLLPENLIELVLARLPVANLLRLRSVCKKWSGLLANKSFLAACSEVNSNEPYFAKLSYPEDGRWLMSYDPSRSRWYNVSIGYFPRTVGIPLSSSGGLICFVNNTRDSGSRRHGPVLFVSNPMTKEWKELPRGFPWEESPEYEETPLVSLIMCKRPSHYKVIVVETGCTQIFDSVDGGWRKTKCLIREGVLRKESARKAVLNVHNLAFCNGSLYLLTPSNCTLMAFSIQDEVWSRVQSDRLPGHPKFRNLATCNGHVVMVGRSEQQEQVVSVCVWFLEWKTMKWLEGGRMPQHMSQLMMSDAMRCCVVLQFSSYGDSILFDSSRHDLSFLFNMAKGTWCSVEHWPNSCQSIAFEPRLDAQV